ncbi:twitch domain-containing radical SAM protein [Mesorhizobium sp. LNHC209A00]|uniref:twitch domain-containing radical SAM protein n=1 Tax=Mesorhizobium TaxID=68287 RepID=UPI0018DCA176|nr:twitch domain-containing radical SAM protein [Mesorhizobium sp. LNHC209A00]
MAVSPIDSFCLLPWIHAHVSAQGRRKLCCVDVSLERYAEGGPEASLEDYWNSEEVKGVRREMLSGTLPKRCGHCSNTGNRTLSYKDEVLSRWPEMIEQAIASTADDGSTTLQPVTFDYRTSTCNLRCRICGPHSSTSAEIEARRNIGLQELGEHVHNWDPAYLDRRTAALGRAHDELITAAKQRRVRHLYWAGGEPLMDSTHWDVMSELATSGEAANVDVAYNTNLTVFSYRGQSVENLWPCFNSVYVQASIDGVGQAGEYIRTGFKTDIFTRNLDTLLDMTRRHACIRAALDLTLTSVGLLHLGDLLQFALKRKIHVTAKLMVPRGINRYMAVEFLPQQVRADWCRKWMIWIDAHDRDRLFDTVYSTLELALLREKVGVDAPPKRSGYDAKVIGAFEGARHDQGRFQHLLSVDQRLINYSGE